MPSAATGLPWKCVISFAGRCSMTMASPDGSSASSVVVGAAIKKGILHAGSVRAEHELLFKWQANRRRSMTMASSEGSSASSVVVGAAMKGGDPAAANL